MLCISGFCNLRLAFIVYVCAEKLRGSDRISDKEISLAKKLYAELGSSIREKNASDLYKLAGILEKSEKELGIGIEEPFPLVNRNKYSNRRCYCPTRFRAP